MSTPQQSPVHEDDSELKVVEPPVDDRGPAQWKLVHLCEPGRSSAREIKEAAARRGGCATKEEIHEFLHPSPDVPNHIARLADYPKARNRLARAIDAHEKIVIYGDYDCDGITALVQLHDLVIAADHPLDQLAWFIPDRMDDGYGLTDSGVRKCVSEHHPRLVICVDCASTATEQLRWLRDQGVDTIVIDHHNFKPLETDHPAHAHLNPRACRALTGRVGQSGSDESILLRLQQMSAAGLVFLFAEQFQTDRAIPSWNRKRALLLAGLGTFVDVMPLTGNNRALVKASLSLANDTAGLALVPGLTALDQICRRPAHKRIDGATYGFQWGPRINASGRMEDAVCSVKLLLATNVAEAECSAASCDSVNKDRQQEQATILEEAIAQTSVINARDKVLVLAKREWHPGIVGIVAGRLKERFFRPAIVLGWDHAKGCWRGSGRSVEGFSIGSAVSEAQDLGMLLGGGHDSAAGMSIEDAGLDGFRRWINSRCNLEWDDFRPSYSVVAASCLTDSDLSRVMQELEPFGNGNPRILLHAAEAHLCEEPSEMLTKNNATSGKDQPPPWAMKARFRLDAGGPTLYATWRNVDRAKREWEREARYDLILEISETFSQKHERMFVNWAVRDCMRMSENIPR